MSTDEVIVGRLLCELRQAGRIAVGPGLPRGVLPYLRGEQSWVDLSQPVNQLEEVDLGVVEAREVSENGNVVAAGGTNLHLVEARNWIVAGRLRTPGDELRILKECTCPPQIREGAGLIVTDLGVIRVSEIGFELLEISPGVGSDDVRMEVQASLHVVDNIKRIQLCA